MRILSYIKNTYQNRLVYSVYIQHTYHKELIKNKNRLVYSVYIQHTYHKELMKNK